MTFVGGPCTHGPGAIVSKELSKTMRSHNDLLKGLAPMFKDACQHYVHRMFNTGGRTITRRAVGTEKHARKVTFTVVVILGNRRINSSPACKTKIK